MNRSQHATQLIHRCGPQAALFARKPGIGRKVFHFVICCLIGLAALLAYLLAWGV